MSDLSTNERSSFGNVGFLNHANSRTKFQPIRVKDLISESDDDEIEDRVQSDIEYSDVEPESDDPQPLPQNDFYGCNESLQNHESNLVVVSNTQDNGQVSRNICEPSYSDVPAKSEEFMFVDREEKVNSITPESAAFTHGETNTKIEKNINSEVSSNSQCGENALAQEKTYQKQSDYKQMNVNIESSENENFSLKPTTEEQSPNYDFGVKDQQSNCKSSGTEYDSKSLMSRNCGNVLQSNLYNSQCTSGKVESGISTREEQSYPDGSSCYSKLHTSEPGLIMNTVNHSVTDTPLKHAHVNTIHPNPCYSRRNLIQTPQNKQQIDLHKSHAQTPAPISCLWSQNSTRQTPLQNKTHCTKSSLQTPKNPVYLTPNVAKHETPRFFNTDSKSARRPLADAKNFTHNDVPILPMESKSLVLQGMQLSKVDEAMPRPQSDLHLSKSSDNRCNTAKRMLDISENPMQVESSINKQLKENKHPNVIDEFEDIEKQMKSNVSKNKPVGNSNVCSSLKSNSVQKVEKNDKAVTKSTSIEAHNNYPVVSNQNQQQDLKQIADKISNVQFSIPSNVPKSKHSKTLFVKGKEYLILGTLGQGMSGEVLRVQDLSSLELCAIKCVNLSRMDKDSAQGCLEEISMLHKLQAPCIVRMYDYEIKYPMVYVVMEMGDTDLSRLLKSMSQDKQLPLTMILYYWTEMLTAVKHIHDNGVIHSDLKPANFLLVRGRLKLIDFGIASSMNADMTSVVKNCPIGTLNYISPEALMDIGGNADSPTHNVKYKITFKSDVWSLGCILYSLVYGHTPFHHIRSQWAKVNAITNPKPNISFPLSLSSVDGAQKSIQAPPVLIDVMRKCLQHEPKARPTVAQLLQVEYIPTKQERVLASTPDIPADTLVKIKHTLSDDEWRQLIQILENKRYT